MILLCSYKTLSGPCRRGQGDKKIACKSVSFAGGFFQYAIIHSKMLCICSLIFLFWASSTIQATSLSLPESFSITSARQEICAPNIIRFSGDVTLQIHDYFIQSPLVAYNSDDKTAVLQADDTHPIVVSHGDMCLLSKQAHVDIASETLKMQNVRIHTESGFVKVGSAFRKSDGTWNLSDIMYTGCEHVKPHWSFRANHAHIAHSRLYTQWATCYLLRFPLMTLPFLQLPLSAQGANGLLFPHFSYDARSGLGLKQSVFFTIGRQADITVGIDLAFTRGAVGFSQIRMFPDKNEMCCLNGWWGYDTESALYPVADVAGQKSDWWIQSQGAYQLPSLSTGKGIEGWWQGSIGSDECVRKSYYTRPPEKDAWNRGITALETSDERNSITACATYDQLIRERWMPTHIRTGLVEGRYTYQAEHIVHLPRVQWFYQKGDFNSLLQYSHGIYADNALVSRVKRKYIYPTGNTVQSTQTATQMTACAGYMSTFSRYLQGNWGSFYTAVSPQLHLRNNMIQERSEVGMQAATQTCLEWYGVDSVLPLGSGRSGMLLSRPYIKYHHQRCAQFTTWQGDNALGWIPGRHNTLHVGADVSWYGDTVAAHCSVEQPYYFQMQEQGSGMPLYVRMHIDHPVWKVDAEHVYDWRTQTVVFGQTSCSVTLPNGNLTLALAYYDKGYARQQQLLIPGQTFVSYGATWQPTKQLQLECAGQWVCDGPWEKFTPVKHLFGLRYLEHCWGIGLGFEQERACEYSNDATHYSFYIKVIFNPLGSMSAKLRQCI